VEPPVAVFDVLDPGLLTTIQDGGRPGLEGEGVTPGGAADTWSLAVANALVGNEATVAALEVTLLGPTLRAAVTVTVGVAGSLDATVSETGQLVRPGTAVVLRAGQSIAFVPTGSGARGYLAIHGGFAVPVLLGSRSTALGAGFGGVDGRALRAGDRLVAGSPRELSPAPQRWSGPAAPVPGAIRVRPGPHAADLVDALDALVDRTWTVDAASDRVGLRLAGDPLPGAPIGEIASHGVLSGAIQVPPDRRPIVLLADHQPTGGYPVIAVAIRADLPRLAQLAPGTTCRFEHVTAAVARTALVDAGAAYARSRAELSEATAWDDLWHGAGG
jgi:biotin-dependent carboxylase-like uncharacterized protein